ncbi:uncharacterized protein LOC122853680 [Aphidius gifuensis]|uniref:uncharacterized protein LOC122853680 n=1 Tax=Aphidius gifuensis TaxID=684658 RepID=UPI001CDB4E90|nr:uncharacterized protein LOC122853680 [Aphidius gifuensis]
MEEQSFVDIVSSNGYSPISTAICQKNWNMVVELLPKCQPEYAIIDQIYEPLMEYISEENNNNNMRKLFGMYLSFALMKNPKSTSQHFKLLDRQVSIVELFETSWKEVIDLAIKIKYDLEKDRAIIIEEDKKKKKLYFIPKCRVL